MRKPGRTGITFLCCKCLLHGSVIEYGYRSRSFMLVIHSPKTRTLHSDASIRGLYSRCKYEQHLDREGSNTRTVVYSVSEVK